jgi:hypothetical protein
MQVQKIGTPDFMYVQVRRQQHGPGESGHVGLRRVMPEPSFTVRMQCTRGDTIVSIGQSKWADRPVLAAVAFYPLISGHNGWIEQSNLVERTLKLIEAVNDEAARSLTAARPAPQNPQRTSWDLGAVQSAMLASLSNAGSVDLPSLASESNNSLQLILWMAEKITSSGNDYVLTTDKQKILSRKKLKEMIIEKLGSNASAARTNFCPKCGKPVFAGDRFCKMCGTAIS